MASTAKYCTLAEAKAQIDKLKANHDTIIDDVAIPGVSRMIDNFCNRPDGFVALAVATAREYSGDGSTVQWMDECVEVTTVEVKDSPSDTDYVTWAADKWLPATGDPKRPNFNKTPYRFIIVTATNEYDVFTDGKYTTRRGFRPVSELQRSVPTVRITAQWGYAATVPDQIKLACIIETARVYKRGLSAFGDTLTNIQFGQLTYTKTLDPITQQILINGRLVKPMRGRSY